eukprot:TRINITY_DN13923_c0_g1_i1.p1 TRINITY_DN13923_c0_g1~~TRINITY_DN13923_c0_g1_i1.p1  ORF type:complete len:184 (-),score=23.86 TRINITY_DN13923_c0_g1_i1:274-804(-)
MEGCHGCISLDNEDRKRICVFRTKFWVFVLRPDDQRAPPRAVISCLKHIHPDTLPDHIELLVDLYRAKQIATRICREAFRTTRFNWLQAGNLTRNVDDEHAHYHFMPCYDHALEFEGETFTDERFGLALNIDPACGYRKREPSAELLAALKSRMQTVGAQLQLLDEDLHDSIAQAL